MRIVSINVNGIRAALRKGMFDWLNTIQADVICMQEIRADHSILEKAEFNLAGYHSHYVPAERKGYSGVGILSKHRAKKISNNIGLDWADNEGRYVIAEFNNFYIASLYLPSGSHNSDRQTQKYEFMDFYLDILKQQLKQKKPIIVCGDWNIAHTKKDIKNWRSNQKNSGFLPEERAWMDKLINELGYVDAFRVVSQAEDAYTWWSNRGRAWDNNVGWRIDYQIVSPSLKSKVKSADIYKEQRFSDHAPLIIEYDMTPE